LGVGEAEAFPAEPEPPFEGEPIPAEESTGWVQTEIEEDPYGGWEGLLDEIPTPDVEWEREKLEELDERPPPTQRKRKKKGRRPRYREIPDSDW
jgi:hypothetical protein